MYGMYDVWFHFFFVFLLAGLALDALLMSCRE
jgi:hypothetical protein